MYRECGARKTHDATNRRIYNTITRILHYDADHQDGAAAVHIAQLGALAHVELANEDPQIIA